MTTMQSEQYKNFEEQLKLAADSFEPANAEAAWEAMEKKLDKDDNRSLAFIQRLRWLDDAFLMLTILLLLVVPVSKTLHSKKNTTDTVTTKADATKRATTKDAVGVMAENKPVLHEESPGTQKENDFARQTDDGQNINQAAIATTPAANKEKEQRHASVLSAATVTKNSNKKIAGEKAAQVNTVPVIVAAETSLVADEGKSTLNHTALYLNDYRLRGAKMPLANVVTTPTITTGIGPNDMGIQISSAKFKQRFSVSAMGAAEWTSAKDGRPDGAGIGGGILIGYNLNKKLMLQTGLSYSRKLYTGGANTYNPKPGSYWDVVTISEVEADCEVWEIPLRISYVLHHKKNHSFYATGGIAAAIMKQENYHMYYTRPNGTPGYGKPVYSTGTFHPAAALTLGAGFIKPVTNHFQVVAEPFLKLPLSAVGEGSIKLRSGGLAIGLQYRF